MVLNTNQQAFFSLLRAGLWKNCSEFKDPVDWNEVYRLASEQSVVGVVLGPGAGGLVLLVLA